MRLEEYVSRRRKLEFMGFATSSAGVGGALGAAVGIGGGFIMLILLSLLASVGLMVLAPSPEARPDAIDCRLLPDDEGVWARFWFDFEADFVLEGVFGSC